MGIILTDLPFAWGQGVDVNDDGIVLVLAYTEGVMGRAKALLWDPIAGTCSGVGGEQPDGVFPMGLTSDLVVLGKGADQSGDRSRAFRQQVSPGSHSERPRAGMRRRSMTTTR